MRSYGLLVTYLVAAMLAMVALGVVFIAGPATGSEAAVEVVASEDGGPATIEGTVVQPAPMAGEDVVLPPNDGRVVLRERTGRVVLPMNDGRSDAGVHIGSVEDLARLNDSQLRRMAREDRYADVDVYRLRDDLNGGLFRLSNQIRGLNYSYRISGVRNSAGTAATGGSGYVEPVRVVRTRDGRVVLGDEELEFVPAPR